MTQKPTESDTNVTIGLDTADECLRAFRALKLDPNSYVNRALTCDLPDIFDAIRELKSVVAAAGGDPERY